MENRRNTIGKKTLVPTNAKIASGRVFNDFPDHARDGGMRDDYELSLGEAKTTIPASERIAAGGKFDDYDEVSREGERGFVTHRRPGESYHRADGRK